MAKTGDRNLAIDTCGDSINAFDLDGQVCLGDVCVRAPKCQSCADFASGVLDTVTLGQGRRIEGWLGIDDKVRYDSGWRTGGQVASLVVPGAALRAGRAAMGGRGVGLERGNFLRVARHRPHAPMPTLRGGPVRQANWVRAHHQVRNHWHVTWRGRRTPGGR